jgi:hypothetical protein
MAPGWIVVMAGLLSGCGGGGVSGSPGAQFCQSWADAFCQKLYACTPVDQRGADFLGGSSQSQCTSVWTHACTDPPPQGVTFDVNCSGSAHVNSAAKTSCLNELSTISCDNFNSPTYVSVCDQVCGGTSDDAGAEGGAGGGADAGAGGSNGADSGVDAAGGAGGGTGGTGGTGGASTGPNLIVNGDFSSDITDWKITQDAGSVTNGGVTNGQLCVTLGAYTTVTIGWPSDISTVFSLQTGVTYQLSYQARTTGGLPQFEVQVGQGVPPYTQIDFMSTADVPGSQILTFTHGFVLSTPEPQGGMAFNIISGPTSATTVCVAHISLVALN